MSIIKITKNALNFMKIRSFKAFWERSQHFFEILKYLKMEKKFNKKN